MTRHMTSKAMAVAALVLACGPALAGKLPSTAVPMNADEVAKLHSGNTGIYPTVDEYFAADGSTIGTFGKPAVKSTFAGKWVVYGNTLCTMNGGRFDAKIYVDCNSFWRDGDKTLLLWSTHSDGSKADLVNGYYDVSGALKPGNLIADKYKAAGGV